MYGLNLKDAEMLKHIRRFDIIGLSETWVGEERSNEMKLSDYDCIYANAREEKKKKEIAKGSILLGINKQLLTEEM